MHTRRATAADVTVGIDRGAASVYEHGWQSWSPSARYRVGDQPYRPVSENRRTMNYRPDRRAATDAFQGEGLIAVDPGTGEGVHLLAANTPDVVPSVTARVEGDRIHLAVEPGGAEHVTHVVDDGPGGIEGALARWAERFATGTGPLRPAPSMWCSWYHYFTEVTEADVDENVAAMDTLDLPVDVVQIDDGWQSEIGDWRTLSSRFASLHGIVERIHERGRRAGIWVAPFLVGHDSETFRDHPDWLIGDGDAGHGWDQSLAALDPTSPGGEAYLRTVFGELREIGFDVLKLDFVFAAAVEGTRHDRTASGIEAYRRGMRIIREAAGPETFVLGCGAPILPSVGLVDAMRVGPDISHLYEPPDGDQSQPSQRAATRNTRLRAWQHGRFWVNDPDCLVAAIRTEQRERWADVVERWGGLRASSDRLLDLDEWGLETTRRLLRPGSTEPFVSTGVAADASSADHLPIG